VLLPLEGEEELLVIPMAECRVTFMGHNKANGRREKGEISERFTSGSGQYPEKHLVEGDEKNFEQSQQERHCGTLRQRFVAFSGGEKKGRFRRDFGEISERFRMPRRAQVQNPAPATSISPGEGIEQTFGRAHFRR
jgi:hypothetical protein